MIASLKGLVTVPLGVNIFRCSLLIGLARFGDCALDASTEEEGSSFLSRMSWASCELMFKINNDLIILAPQLKYGCLYWLRLWWLAKKGEVKQKLVDLNKPA